MYKLVIEQPNYNQIEFEFDNLRDLLTFMEDAMKYCAKETKLSFTHKVNEESEVNE